MPIKIFTRIQKRLQRRKIQRPVKRAITTAFRRLKANAIGTHGTVSSKLESIRRGGLGGSQKVLYITIPLRDIRHVLSKRYRTGLYRELVKRIQSNLHYAEERFVHEEWERLRLKWPDARPNHMALANYGVVVGRVPDLTEFGEPMNRMGAHTIPKKDILFTLQLTPEEIEGLYRRFPENKQGVEIYPYQRRPNDSQIKKVEKIKHEIAKIFARKAVQKFLANAST